MADIKGKRRFDESREVMTKRIRGNESEWGSSLIGREGEYPGKWNLTPTLSRDILSRVHSQVHPYEAPYSQNSAPLSTSLSTPRSEIMYGEAMRFFPDVGPPPGTEHIVAAIQEQAKIMTNKKPLLSFEYVALIPGWKSPEEDKLAHEGLRPQSPHWSSAPRPHEAYESAEPYLQFPPGYSDFPYHPRPSEHVLHPDQVSYMMNGDRIYEPPMPNGYGYGQPLPPPPSGFVSLPGYGPVPYGIPTRLEGIEGSNEDYPFPQPLGERPFSFRGPKGR